MNEAEVFSLAKVKALRAYYKQCSTGMKGSAEWHDYDTAMRLCDQLLALMSQNEPAAGAGKKKMQVTTSD